MLPTPDKEETEETEETEEVSEVEEEVPTTTEFNYLKTIKPPKKEPLLPSKDPKKLYEYDS